jgi:hypothetical protein
MKLQCPECRELLPSIGRDVARPGDTVQCGLCLHVWRISTSRRPLTSLLETAAKADSAGVTPAEVEMAKRYLARSVASGLTSAPVVMPPITASQIQAAKLRARGLNTHGRPPAGKSSVPGVSARLVRFLDDFLKAQEEPFTILDFKNRLEREGKVLSEFSVALYLQRFAHAKRLTLLARGHRGSKSLYQKLSAPEKDTATRQLASCNGASIPARNTFSRNELRTSNSEHRTPNIELRTSNSELRTPNSE